MKKLEDKNRKKLNSMNGGGAGSSSVASVSRNQKSKVGNCNNDLSRIPVTHIMEEVRSKYYKLNEPLM